MQRAAVRCNVVPCVAAWCRALQLIWSDCPAGLFTDLHSRLKHRIEVKSTGKSPRRGIPRGMVSTRHGNLRSTISHAARYPTRHGIPRGMVAHVPWYRQVDCGRAHGRRRHGHEEFDGRAAVCATFVGEVGTDKHSRRVYPYRCCGYPYRCCGHPYRCCGYPYRYWSCWRITAAHDHGAAQVILSESDFGWLAHQLPALYVSAHQLCK